MGPGVPSPVGRVSSRAPVAVFWRSAGWLKPIKQCLTCCTGECSGLQIIAAADTPPVTTTASALLQTYQGALDMLENVYIKTGGTDKCFGSNAGGHDSREMIELRQGVSSGSRVLSGNRDQWGFVGTILGLELWLAPWVPFADPRPELRSPAFSFTLLRPAFASPLPPCCSVGPVVHSANHRGPHGVLRAHICL
jgi:hypothetical protein